MAACPFLMQNSAFHRRSVLRNAHFYERAHTVLSSAHVYEHGMKSLVLKGSSPSLYFSFPYLGFPGNIFYHHYGYGHRTGKAPALSTQKTVSARSERRTLPERELAEILDPWEEVWDPLDSPGYEERCRRSTFPGETFRVLKEKELRACGEYRTRRLVLEAWERLCS